MKKEKKHKKYLNKGKVDYYKTLLQQKNKQEKKTKYKRQKRFLQK